jgi:IS4 transposase
MDIIPYERGSFYVADKGYTDFLRLHRIHANGSFFVIRAKENLQFRRMYSRVVDKSTGVLNDHVGMLVFYKSRTEYPEKLRRIKYYDSEHDLDLVSLTNNMDLSASDIALLYKKRWAVELFFKWMKQHLKIKSFWGITLNAVKIQMYCAVIAYCLVALVGNKLKVNRSIYEILQILSISLLDKAPIKEILTRCDYNNVKELNNKQLIISGF